MVISTFKLPQSACPTCGENGRFVGMERHESMRNTNVLTFECERCGHYAIEKDALKSPSKLIRNPKTN